MVKLKLGNVFHERLQGCCYSRGEFFLARLWLTMCMRSLPRSCFRLARSRSHRWSSANTSNRSHLIHRHNYDRSSRGPSIKTAPPQLVLDSKQYETIPKSNSQQKRYPNIAVTNNGCKLLLFGAVETICRCIAQKNRA